MLWQQGWLWIIAGIALAIAETLLPGFILLGFAVGAVLTGLLVWTGLLGSSLPVLLLVFALLSAAGWLGLKRAFTRSRDKPKIWHRDINEN